MNASVAVNGLALCIFYAVDGDFPIAEVLYVFCAGEVDGDRKIADRRAFVVVYDMQRAGGRDDGVRSFRSPATVKPGDTPNVLVANSISFRLLICDVFCSVVFPLL